MKTFYIGSSFRNIEQVHLVAQALIGEGFIHSYDWTRLESIQSVDELATIGEHEKEAIICSDSVIFILPLGKSSHVELGIALASQKPVYLYSQTDELFTLDHTSSFYHLEGIDRFVGTFDAFLDYLFKKLNIFSKKD
ncbi:group-specific protein [Alkalicoccobacillus gibsonii]|uniref:group-specific protein n=1 Tax=Alkalicoccobacillus gibsonii TaxID=79881 RepID=UPI00193430C0|nr:group-specific protein [Alkalicoccobacillus gibsonii]MBM0065538.1 group-specific protein [Alkalicoccobacillus gibsonii]